MKPTEKNSQTSLKLRAAQNLIIFERISSRDERARSARIIRDKDVTITVTNAKQTLQQIKTAEENRQLRKQMADLQTRYNLLEASLQHGNLQHRDKLDNTRSELDAVKKKLASGESFATSQARIYEDLQDTHAQTLTDWARQRASIKELQDKVAYLMSVEDHFRQNGGIAEAALCEARENLVAAREELQAATNQAQSYRNALSVQAIQFAAESHRLENVRSQRDAARLDCVEAKAMLNASHGVIERLERTVSAYRKDKIAQESLRQALLRANERKDDDAGMIKALESDFSRSQKWLEKACKELEVVTAKLEKRKRSGPHDETRAAKRRG